MKLNVIHSDSRGEIAVIEDAIQEEFTLFKTLKGKARGGCIHDSDEYLIVIDGSIKLVLNDQYFKVHKGTSIFIPKGTVHYFIALEDCIVSEWGVTKGQKGEHDINARKIVDEINSTI